MKTKSALIIADLHYPNHNSRLLTLIEEYMKTQKWDELVYLGDALDMDAISHHAMEARDFRSLEGKRLKKDYDDFAKILRRHRKIVGKDCIIHYFLGNHEEWADKMVNQYPGIEGMIEPKNCLPFGELNIKIVTFRDFYKISKVFLIHGDIQRGYTPVNIAKKIVDVYNRNVVAGHNHTLQSYTKIAPQGIDDTHTAYTIPCVGDINPDWNRGMPTRWINGFGVLRFTDDNFTFLPIVAVKNKFISPEGKLYE